MGLRTRAFDLTGHLSALAGHLIDIAGHLSFLVQWAVYRLVLALDPLRERLPGLGRDPSLWVFGARGGEAFTDNAKYLYLHVAAERTEIRPVWLSKDPTVVADLQSAGYEAYHCYSLRGLWVNLRAGVVLLTQGHRDLAMPCCAGAFAVQLWHGVPLKHVSWDAEFPDLPRPVRTAHADMVDEIDLLTVPGRALISVFQSGLRIDPDRTVVTGYPRNDALLARIPGEEIGTDAGALARARDLAAGGRVVVYLPTFREWTDDSVADHLDVAALDAFLAERDATLVIKTHPKESFDLPDGHSRVVQLPAATDPYPLLRRADALVTDYSSVYFDYLLVDRPAVFYPYDLDEYRARRGFYFDYESVTPGPVARTFDDLLAGLDRALAEPAVDGERRRALRAQLLDGDPLAESRTASVDSGTNVDSATTPIADGRAPARDRRTGRARDEWPVRATRSAVVYESIRDRLAD